MPGECGVPDSQGLSVYLEFLFKAQPILLSHHFSLTKDFSSFLPPCWLFLTVRTSYIHWKNREKT